MAALLTSIMGGANEKVGYYIEECRRMGISVLPPDINASKASFSVVGEVIRFGLAGVKNIGENAINALVTARNEGGKFTSLVDLCTRVDMRVVNKRVIESLIKCGAFDSQGARRSQLMAVLEQAIDIAASRQRDAANGQLGLFGEDTLNSTDDITLPDIPEMPNEQLLALEKEMTGFYVSGHPLDQYRDKIKHLPNIDSLTGGSAVDGKAVKVAGLITSAKRITTKSGGMMCFLALEDFTSQIEVVVFPRLFEKNNRILLPDTPVVVAGRLNANEDSSKIIADEIAALDTVTVEVRIKIRKQQENQEIFSRLKEIFVRYHGPAVVYLHLIDSRRVIKTEPQFWLEPSPAAIGAMENILGKGVINVT
jgi:DNA polymerase-3 subunit alpha